MLLITTFYLIRMPHIRNSSPPTFHPDVSHPEFCPANVLPYPDVSHPEFLSAAIPPGCLTPGILPRQRSTFHPDISHSEFYPADVQPSPDVSHQKSYPPTFNLPPNILHPEFCPADVPPFSSSLEHFLEVPKISSSINFAAIFFSACNFNNFRDFKMF